ncbi:MAG: VWA domain-containing protein [Cyanobacteria bacterium]|nr:VWA domain-containing protein [Cyanobacteriota bacterium]
MPYRAEISRTNPSCFIILVDQSASMREPIDNDGKTKAQAVADAVNGMLQNIISKCTKSDGIRDYYHTGVIGYGGDGVGPVFSGILREKQLVPVSLVGNYPLRVEQREKMTTDRKGDPVIKKSNFPIWFEPRSAGNTPMCEAIGLATQYLKKWLPPHANCFPPIVINISDGESSDGSPDSAAHELMALSSNDGPVLLFNLFISGVTKKQVEYPHSDTQLGDEYARALFNISSPLTTYMRRVLNDEGFPVEEGARGFVYNAGFSALIRFLDIGTRPSLLR